MLNIIHLEKISDNIYEVTSEDTIRRLYDSDGFIVALESKCGGEKIELGHNFGENKLLRDIYEENNKLLVVIS